MTFPDNAFTSQEIIVKILWLCIRFILLLTELSVLLFGICFGRSNSNRPSIKTLKVLIISFMFASIYITIQAVLEFRGDTRPIKFQTSDYHLYSYGGMKFLLISSSIFLSMYIIVFFLPCLCHRHKKYLPIRRSFYLYCFVLALINMIQIIGTILNLTDATINSIWSNVLIPRIIYADSTINDDEDDDLIDPGVNTLIDNSTNDRLDGQFDDITSSTRIIHPVI
ncbi:unnamed protein product [Rotaria sp. Silwood2]|nr:unnamed protein product [Rotaria sp. Silwood2]CAF3963800.1 unnamed protein product [Rotaria sp. Silwood2]